MENKHVSARIGFSQGVYPDGWTGPESYIEFLNCAAARVFYFVPNNPSELDQKTVHFFDGVSSGKTVAKRGEFHVIEAKRNPHGIVALQLYCNELESTSNGDSRPLGVLITRIELDGVQADIQFSSTDARQISVFDLHRDYRVIA